MPNRIIARLDIKGDNVVRGIHMEGLRKVGKPEIMSEHYYLNGIDEIIFIDLVASLYGRNHLLTLVEKTSSNTFIPICVGGGINNSRDVEGILRAGADKIAINTSAVKNPSLIKELSYNFGSQCVVSQIEAKKNQNGGWNVLIENARQSTEKDVIEWAKECTDLGAGELLIISVDNDGTRRGFDIELIEIISNSVDVPIIASGGPGSTKDVIDCFETGRADAVALGSILHFNICSIQEIRNDLIRNGITVRPLQ